MAADDELRAAEPAARVRRPRVFVAYAYDSPSHENDVVRLCELLFGNGVDVRFDQWFLRERRGWGEWTGAEIRAADYVLAVASPAFRRAGDGEAGADEHRGVQAETRLLRELLQQDLPTWRRKILPVVLPGQSWRDVPSFLSPCNDTHFVVSGFTVAGAEDLLRHLTQQPPYVPPQPGDAPHLPPRRSGVGASCDPATDEGSVWTLSRAAVESCDVIVERVGAPVVRLSHGAYVPRTVEARLLERLVEPGVTAVVGEAGHGKTALLWRMHQVLTHAGRAPMLVPASALIITPPDPPIVTLEAIAEVVDRAQHDGLRPVLLVDTLDLLLHDLPARAQVNRLLALAARLRVPTLVTTRPVESRWLDINYDEPDAGEPDASGSRPPGVKGVALPGFDRAERPVAIAAYARAFYQPGQVDEVIRLVDDASVRGLPLREICSNPLALRMLFELYASADERPPGDIDAIGLYEQYWQRRVERDDRGAGAVPVGTDLTAPTEAVGLTLLADGAIEGGSHHLIERVRPLIQVGAGVEAAEAVAAMRSRGILQDQLSSPRLRFFHQTFFEYAAARGVASSGAAAFGCLVDRVTDDPMDLLSGEVAGQVLLLSERFGLVAGTEADAVLIRWLGSDDPGLAALALRTYARRRHPGRELRAAAAAALGSAGLESVRGYLSLLPSVHHVTFDRAGAELVLVWQRAEASRQQDPKTSRQLSINVLETLVRLAASHPAKTLDFVEKHLCLDWLTDQPPAEWRHHGGLCFRLLDPLLQERPGWCASQLIALFKGFASNRDVVGMAETLTLLNRIDAQMPLPAEDLATIIELVVYVEAATNATQLETEYAGLRARSLTLAPGELLTYTVSVVAENDGVDTTEGSVEEPAPWSVTGRRAELRALIRLALTRSDLDPDEYWNTLLSPPDRRSQKNLCVLLSLALDTDPAASGPLTVTARQRCTRALRQLPSTRRRDGSLPLPALFVIALYEGRVGGAALRASLPPDTPDELWMHAEGLLPLLAPAALAGHAGAVRALQAFVAGASQSDGSNPRVRRAVLGRLREAAREGTRPTFGFLVDYATATGESTDLAAVLGTVGKAELGVLAPHQQRLRRLRESLVSSADAGAVQDGYQLWRLLLERGLDSPPDPVELAAALGRAPTSPLSITVLAAAVAAVDSPEWTDTDLTQLTGVLREYLEPGQQARLRHRGNRAGADRGPRDLAGEAAMTRETQARQLLIGIHARHLPFPATAKARLLSARDVLELVWDAGYDLADHADLTAFSACLGAAAPLLERMPDPTSAVDLILDTAERLSVAQRIPTRCRKRAAGTWGSAIAITVRMSTESERRRLVTGLLASDQDMAQVAVDTYIEDASEIPPWLRSLQPQMSPDSRRRLTAAMKRVARTGGMRPFPELYQAATCRAAVTRDGQG
jgi:hypothetical protein